MRHSRKLNDTPCMRQLSDKESLVIHADLEPDDLNCLIVIRKFCQSFAPTGNGAWIDGFVTAEDMWGEKDGVRIAHRLMHVLQAMRESRSSVFSFSSPTCPVCSQILTEHERRLITAIRSARQGRPERAGLQLLMLCEGNPTDDVMEQLKSLATVFSEKDGSGPSERARPAAL
ncbi:hypothetical protein AB9K34_07415 [Sedimentitalea sp. XS_ASV28]|uniref:hypothetical protein n=1 Tax=Sedimentitalea sp. XS_ASV28 TaxID=3241296 RepID=UPI003511AADA